MEATLTLKAQDQISAPLKNVKANVQGLAAPLKSAGGGLTGLGRALKGAGDQAGQSSGRLKTLAGGFKSLAVGAGGLALGLGKLALSVGLVGANLAFKLGRHVIRRIITDFKNLGKAAITAAKDLYGVGTALAQTFAKVTALGAGLAYSFKRVFVDLSAGVEDFQRQLSNALGDKILGAEALKNVRKFSAATGRELQDATAAFVSLADSGLKPTEKHLSTLADMAAKKNKTLAETGEAFKRALKGDENALEEWGVKSQKIGKSVLYQYKDQTGKMVNLAARANNPEALAKLLTRLSGDVAGGAEKERGETMQGGLAKLTAKWAEFRAMVMDSGPFNFLKGELSNVLKWVERLEENGGLANLAKEWGENLTGALKKVKEGLIAGWEKLRLWAPKVRELVSALGGAKAVAIGLAAALSGPLIGALGKSFKSLAALAMTPVSGPLGLLAAALGGITAAMAKAGVLAPFLEGVAAGFKSLSAGLSEAFVGLLDSVGEIFAGMGFSLRDANGQINPQAWKDLGFAIGEFTNGALGTLITMLKELVELLKTVGGGLGSLAGVAMIGEDSKAMVKVSGKSNALDQRMRETMAAQGGKATPEQVSGWQRERADIDHERKVAQGKASRDYLGRASGFSAVTHGPFGAPGLNKYLPDARAAADPSRSTPSDIQNPESITGPVSTKLDAVNDTLSRPQDIGNPGDITGPMVPLLQGIESKVNQPIPLNVSLKVSGSVNGANVQTEAKVTRGGGQVSDSTKLSMGHRGTTP